MENNNQENGQPKLSFSFSPQRLSLIRWPAPHTLDAETSLDLYMQPRPTTTTLLSSFASNSTGIHPLGGGKPGKAQKPTSPANTKVPDRPSSRPLISSCPSLPGEGDSSIILRYSTLNPPAVPKRWLAPSSKKRKVGRRQSTLAELFAAGRDSEDIGRMEGEGGDIGARIRHKSHLSSRASRALQATVSSGLFLLHTSQKPHAKRRSRFVKGNPRLPSPIARPASAGRKAQLTWSHKTDVAVRSTAGPRRPNVVQWQPTNEPGPKRL
ncbi:hypothetical protein B0T25DRAFT_341595 [Lasiosphaeria hispida]|uniref:Uncharacterized protein n=1 Tax=Lasiosphaeria hispida TaxID=260671 RepID=A0AAJ0H6D7_9PEZI|nr:hypothetical protein B0T25DRAFT_341595 [Lasiosphaeria hispida]